MHNSNTSNNSSSTLTYSLCPFLLALSSSLLTASLTALFIHRQNKLLRCSVDDKVNHITQLIEGMTGERRSTTSPHRCRRQSATQQFTTPRYLSTAAVTTTTTSATLSPALQHSSIDRHHHAAVVVVDPISTGSNIASLLMSRGVPVIRVWSGYVNENLQLMIDPSIRTDFVATLSHDAANPFKTIATLNSLPYEIVSVVSGSELGIEVTDFVSEQLGCPTNGTELTNARRDKYQMGEQVRRCGVRAVKQARVQSWSEVEVFLEDLKPSPFQIIVKPIRSAGSDNVYKSSSAVELKEKFQLMLGAQNQLGLCNDALVVQEFLCGTEYVVDTVSRTGQHKVVAIWEYDKRTANGHDFVYFGQGSISGNSEIGQQLAAYTRKVLTALNIVEGAGHAEIVIDKNGPCLIEIGARCHGCEGTFMPLADRIWGYNQVSALIATTLSQQEFDAIPDVCGDEIQYGFKVDFVSFVSGTLVRLDHLDEISSMKSFLRFDLLPRVGDWIPLTIDCFSPVGSVSLCHPDKTVVVRDHERIRELEKMMFVVEQKEGSDADKQPKRF